MRNGWKSHYYYDMSLNISFKVAEFGTGWQHSGSVTLQGDFYMQISYFIYLFISIIYLVLTKTTEDRYEYSGFQLKN